jgi:hypothetical protein
MTSPVYTLPGSSLDETVVEEEGAEISLGASPDDDPVSASSGMVCLSEASMRMLTLPSEK